MNNNTNLYRRKINNLEDLELEDLIIMKSDENSVQNNIQKLLDKKKLLPIDLATLIGMTKQNMTYILNEDTVPSVEIALKISHTLGIPVDEIFELNENAWIKQYIYHSKPLYIDVVNLEILEYSLVKKIIKSNGFEYYDTSDKKYLSKENRNTLYKEYINKYQEDEVLKILNDNSSFDLRKIKSIAIKKLEKNFNTRYIKIFNRLGKKIKPYVL